MDATLLFLHGAWVTPLCWERFVPYFEAKGFRTLAPPWPGKEAPIEDQRRSPSPRLQRLGIEEIAGHYADEIRRLPAPPILIGHSFGGLFVQLLLDRGLGRAGVAIDPAPPRGVFSFYPTAFRSLGRALTTWRGWERILRIPFSDFRYAFLNRVPADQQHAIYDRYVVPETGRVFFQAAFSALSRASPAAVDFRKRAAAPLLVIAGGADHIVPPQINRTNFRRLKRGGWLADFLEFPGRGHWIIAEPGWQEVADSVAAWIDRL